jgi:hypothetical protein
MRALIRGVVGGALATSAMSVPTLVAGRAGVMGKQPPERLTEAALEVAPVDQVSERAENQLAVASHYAFGIGCGVLYALAYERVRPPGPALLHGIGFGLAVWGASYLGWIPSIGVLPPAHRDRAGRALTMVAAHVVFGAVLGRTASVRQ